MTFNTCFFHLERSMIERNELAAAVYAGPNICPAVQGVAHCLAAAPWWSQLAPQERKQWLAPLARLVSGTKTDDTTAVGRAWLAVDQACMTFVPVSLERVAAALEYRHCDEFSTLLRRNAAALQALFHADGSRPLDTYLRDMVREAARAIDVPYVQIVRDGGGLSRAVSAAREVVYVTLAAVRAASRPVEGTVHDSSWILSVGVDVGTAGLAAVRATAAAGSDIVAVANAHPPGTRKRPAVAILASRDLVRDKMIGLVHDMCALKPGRSGLNGYLGNGKG
jgi:hypothetical protein